VGQEAEQMSAVNGKIVSLAELQIFSDLADLHDTAFSSEEARARMTAMLRQYTALDVTNLTEYLDVNSNLDEKHEAALLLIRIVKNDAYLTSINLNYNRFPVDDLRIIISTLINVKEFSSLQVIGLVDAISKDDAPKLAAELLALKKHYGKGVQLDPSISMLLDESKTRKTVEAKDRSSQNLFAPKHTEQRAIPTTPSNKKTNKP
jgi:hypothetical protein